jgi:dihydrofolate reductase
MQDVGLHLMGRNTYEEMAEFWPVSDDAYAAPMNEIPKVVFSRTLERAEWADSRIACGELAEEIAELKGEPGKDMLAWGGAAFAQSLSRHGLVDEYRLILQPVVLGQGLPLFKDLTAPLRLELVDAQTYANGAALHAPGLPPSDHARTNEQLYRRGRWSVPLSSQRLPHARISIGCQTGARPSETFERLCQGVRVEGRRAIKRIGDLGVLRAGHRGVPSRLTPHTGTCV